MEHPDESLIMRYAAGMTDNDETLIIDTHIDACGDCFRSICSLLDMKDKYLYENFTSVWGAWTAGEHGKQLLKFKLVNRCSADNSCKKAAIDRFASDCGVGVRILFDRIGKTAVTAGTVNPDYYTPVPRPVFLGVGSPGEALAGTLIDESSRSLALNLVEPAKSMLKQAVSLAPGAARSSVLDYLGQDGGLRLHAAVDARSGRLIIIYMPSGTEKPPASVLLIPDIESSAAIAREFIEIKESNYLYAEFDDIPDGLFSIVL